MKNSLKALLSEVVDYAGLFPPSQVSMSIAVQNFNTYLKGEHSWMLGRFVVPAARLEEFSESAEECLDGKNLWRLSVLAGGNLSETLEQIEEFNQTYDGKAKIDSLEVKVEEATEITEAAKILPPELKTYFEFPPNDILADFITALALSKQRAKIRTGGVTVDAFPSTDEIIKFMRLCVAANIPFKATAGLHHPLRCVKPLTYETNAPTGTMNGFLNLFLSACLLRQNLNSPQVHRLMNETDGENFEFEEEEIFWTNQNISLNTINLTRQKNAISFGSCSFTEPVEDLQKLEVF
jgi:hypothetical protein